ncbi:MAG: hypothetical protein M3Z32_11700 [Acidobacteriota bacterium]|nr:hypothetical protein [Acidobacteriota bacterium]
MPSALNQSLQTSTPGSMQSFVSPSTAYSYSANLASGDEYHLTLVDTTQVLEVASPAMTPVPEARLTRHGGLGCGSPWTCPPSRCQVNNPQDPFRARSPLV